jgi:MFS family permease
MGGLLFGYDFVVIGGAKPFYEKYFLITSENLSGWANSCALAGCLIGAILSGGLSDRYGRKRLLILAGFLFTTSSIGNGLADTFSTFVIWRILGGVAIGLASNLSPMYIAEVAPAGIRGKLVAINQLTIVIGALMAQVVNWQVAEIVPNKATTPAAVVAKIDNLNALAKEFEAKSAAPEAREKIATDIQEIDAKSRDLQSRYPTLDLSDKQAVAELMSQPAGKDAVEQIGNLAGKVEWWEIYDSWNGKSGWRWMFGLTAIPSLFFFLLMFFVPESPRWLAKNGKPEQAQSILGRIGGAAYAKQAIDDIEATLVNEVEKVNFRDLLEPKMRKVLFLGVVLAFFQQWCGVNTLINYADTVYTSAGYGVSDLMLNIVIVSAVNLISTFIAIFTIDRFGRRILMLLGAAGLAVIYFLIGACFHYHILGAHIFSLIIAVMACFAFSLGPTVWVIISEIFPNRIRGAAVSVSVFALWLGCFSLVYTFPQLIKVLSVAGTFWAYSGICLAGFVFIWRNLPETKGKSLEEIEKELVD